MRRIVSLFIPKNTPYCHYKFKRDKKGRVYAKPCIFWCKKKFKDYECELEQCRLLKQPLYIQDQVKDCGINEDEME